jgi:hypothetical protein
MEDQVVLSTELLAVMRRAVDLAIADRAALVDPRHILLALFDDASVAEGFVGLLDRATVEQSLHAPRRPPAPPAGEEEPDAGTPELPAAPPDDYDTLAFRTSDGSRSRWLDPNAYHVFLEGARRSEKGPYLPKQLAYGYVAEATRDKELLATLGSDPQAVTAAVYAL